MEKKTNYFFLYFDTFYYKIIIHSTGDVHYLTNCIRIIALVSAERTIQTDTNTKQRNTKALLTRINLLFNMNENDWRSD